MSRMRIEQETTITYNAEEKDAILWSAWPPMLRKLKKWGLTPYQTNGTSAWFHIPKRYIGVRNPLLVRKPRSGHGFQPKKQAS